MFPFKPSLVTDGSVVSGIQMYKELTGKEANDENDEKPSHI